MRFRPTRLPAPSGVARAMVLVEALVAGGVIAVAAGLFLVVLANAATLLKGSQDRSGHVLLASLLLREAQADPPREPRRGRAGTRAWTVTCTDPSTVQSPRLRLVACRADVVDARRPDGAAVVLSSDFVAPRAPADRP